MNPETAIAMGLGLVALPLLPPDIAISGNFVLFSCVLLWQGVLGRTRVLSAAFALAYGALIGAALLVSIRRGISLVPAAAEVFPWTGHFIYGGLGCAFLLKARKLHRSKVGGSSWLSSLIPALGNILALAAALLFFPRAAYIWVPPIFCSLGHGGGIWLEIVAARRNPPQAGKEP